MGHVEEPMRVVLIDHALYRMGLRLFLESAPDCEVVGEAGSANEAFEIIGARAPDVVVVDAVLPGLRGAGAIRKMRRRAPGVHILILTEHGRIRDVVTAVGAGARGYALKGDSSEEILHAVRTVQRGRLYLAPALAPPRAPDVSFAQAARASL